MAVREPRGLSWWPSLEGLRGESQAPVAVTVAAGRGHPPGPVAQSAEFMTLVLHFVLSQEPRRDGDAHVSCPCDTGRQRQPRETLRPLPGRPHAAGAPPRRDALHLPRPLPGPASAPARVCSPGPALGTAGTSSPAFWLRFVVLPCTSALFTVIYSKRKH